MDIGILDFGKDITGKANVAVWRTRGDEKQLVGEFAFQCKFKRRDEVHDAAKKHCEQFFCLLQQKAEDRLALGTTKTAAGLSAQRQSASKSRVESGRLRARPL